MISQLIGKIDLLHRVKPYVLQLGFQLFLLSFFKFNNGFFLLF
jgi:hypothetical protein